jgi:hypothetical protein
MKRLVNFGSRNLSAERLSLLTVRKDNGHSTVTRSRVSRQMQGTDHARDYHTAAGLFLISLGVGNRGRFQSVRITRIKP